MTFQDLGAPTWTSALSDRVRRKGPERTTAGDWLRFVLASAEHGISKDEIRFSGVAVALLTQHGEHDVLARRQVLAAVMLKAAMPRMQLAVDETFRPSAEWAECALRIDPKQHIKRGLFGEWPVSCYVKRYQHRSLGWSVALVRHADLMHAERKWWLVLDPKGKRAVDQPEYGFTSAKAALAQASMLMQRQFAKSARARHAPRWERFSLQGLGPYAELLITLPDWAGSFYSPVHFPGARNLLVHLRTNLCDAEDGRRVLFLDEVQSDWHASLAGQAGGEGGNDNAPGLGVPFARDWPLLALKFALWWAGQQGLSGLAWSTPELHLSRWRGYGPPTEIYRRGLPDAAGRLARVLQLELSRVALLRRRVRSCSKPEQQWQVFTATGSPACRGFSEREQADRFADLTGEVDRPKVPVLWLPRAGHLKRMPLFGAADTTLWQDESAPVTRGKTPGMRPGSAA